MIPGRTACLRCVLPGIGLEDVPEATIDPPFSTLAFSPIEGMAASLQTAVTLQHICGLSVGQEGRLLQFDSLRMECAITKDLKPKADCPDCGKPGLQE
jgi:hypothetical protein